MFPLFVLFLILLSCSAFFSASETALFSLSRVQIHRFRESKSHVAAKLVEMLRTPRHTLVTVLLGNEFANVAISIVGAAIISRAIPCSVEAKTVIAVSIITPIIMIFGEMIPKSIALRSAPQLAPIFAEPIHLFYHLITPLRRALSWISNRVVALVSGEAQAEGPMIMEEEFRRLVDLGSKRGVIVEEEREIIHNVFAFTDKTAGNIMTKGDQLFALSIDLAFDEVLAHIKGQPFNRIPFYEGERSNIIGVLHVSDLFSFQMRRAEGRGGELRALLRKPVFIRERTPLEEVLKGFQQMQVHMAFVVREGAGVVGVVTMHDVQEELFGRMEGGSAAMA
jgi:magnesium and cobalt exporter, CNNM family